VQSVSAELLASAGLESLNVERVLAAGQAFNTWLSTQWPDAKRYIEYPISMVNDHGQRLSGSIDLLVETPKGWIVIDHKSTSTGIDQLPHIAAHYGGQLAAYKAALETVTDKPVLGQWIHFMAMGVVLECGV
jgi:ATP-dependent exoDNAse (exonuclease V) beta subunit